MKYLFLIIFSLSFQAFSQMNCEQAVSQATKKIETVKNKTANESVSSVFFQSMILMKARQVCAEEHRVEELAKQGIDCKTAKLNYEKVKLNYEKGKIVYEREERKARIDYDPYRKASNAWWKAARTWVNEANKDDPTDKEIWDKASKAFDRARETRKASEVTSAVNWEKYKASPSYESFNEAGKVRNVMLTACGKAPVPAGIMGF